MKPSEMGLHRKVRYEIMFESTGRAEQVKEIIKFAIAFYDFIYDYIEKNNLGNMETLAKQIL